MIRWKIVKGDSLGIENAYRLDSRMNDGKYLGYIGKLGKWWVSVIDDDEIGQEIEMLHSTKSQAKKKVEGE